MPLAFVDIETTGSHLRYDRIIEIGILRVENDKLIQTYQKLINPETYVSPFIQTMTGIYEKDLEGQPTFEEVKDEIMEILDGAIFIAHNVRFDYGFVKNEFKRYGTPYNAKQLCTVKLSRSLFPEFHHHNLDALIRRFNFEVARRHRAFDDAEVLWKFYRAIHAILPGERIEKTVKALMKRPSIPLSLNENDLEALPESPGVYIFYGNEKIPLYIGKSVNIKERVLSHFTADQDSPKELRITQQIKRIETVETVGELGALLTEASLIKKLQPLYNHHLRKSNQIVLLNETKNPGGYTSVKIEGRRSLTAGDARGILGIFLTKRKAKEYLKKKAEEHFLCQKLLGLEKTAKSCFAYKLHKCKGACLGKENPLAYNIRFIQAFSERKIKSWPFPGAVCITEYDPIEQKKERYVVRDWCLLRGDETELVFDYDTYKILVQYVLNRKNQRSIYPLKEDETVYETD